MRAGSGNLLRMRICFYRCSASLLEVADQKVPGTRKSVENDIGPGSKYRRSTHRDRETLRRVGSLVKNDVDDGRKTACRGSRRVGVDQGKNPYPIRFTEGERLHPPR